jgi:D-mannonate dehydratase
MYEDWSAGRITEYNFNMLSEKYQREQQELEEKIQKIREAVETAVQTESDAGKWVDLIKQYTNPTELTAELLNTLIEKIVVHEAIKHEDGSREQEVEIFYRFIGKID